MAQQYRNLLAITAVILFFSGLPLFLVEFELLNVRSIIGVFGYGLLALPLVILSVRDCVNHTLPLVIWCFAFMCISMAWFFLGAQSSLAVEGLQYRAITVGILLVVMFILLNAASLFWARVAVAIWSFLAVGFNIYDLLNPMTIGFFAGRASGIYLNPNVSAEALILGMLLCVTLLRPLWRTWFVLLIGIGVLTTFSRSGILAYSISVLGLVGCRLIPTKSFLITLPVASLIAAFGVATLSWDTLMAGWDKEGIITSTGVIQVIEERINWFSDPSTSDSAMTERVEGAEQAWRIFSEHPFFGGGTGTNFDVWAQSDEFRKPGPHNIYLWLIVDYGIIGAFIFPALLLAVGWRAHGETRKLVIIMTFVLLLMGFSSHNLLDGRHVLFSLGALSAMVAQGKVTRDVLWQTSAKRESPALGNTAHSVYSY